MQTETRLITGSKAPGFSLPDGKGSAVSLSDTLPGKGVLLAFIHDVWCPQCMQGVMSLSRTYWFIRRLEITLLVVAGQSEESLSTYLATQNPNLPFSILADEDGHVFEMYDLAEEIDLHLARATFYIDQNGIIQKINRGLKFGILTPFGL